MATQVRPPQKSRKSPAKAGQVVGKRALDQARATKAAKKAQTVAEAKSATDGNGAGEFAGTAFDPATAEKRTPKKAQTKNGKDEESTLNPFDPKRLRIAPRFLETGGTKLRTNIVPVKVPNDQMWFRTHPDPAFRLEEVAILKMKNAKDSDKFCLVDPDLVDQLEEDEWRPYWLILTYDHQSKVVFWWPIPMPYDGKHHTAHSSAAEHAETAIDTWLKIRYNGGLQGYEAREPVRVIPEPDWPENITPEGLLEIAFRRRYVKSLDHPAIIELRG
jgi:hypothetical protein